MWPRETMNGPASLLILTAEKVELVYASNVYKIRTQLRMPLASIASRQDTEQLFSAVKFPNVSQQEKLESYMYMHIFLPYCWT